MSKFSRGGGLWVIGRVGILMAFVILPIIRERERRKMRPIQEAHSKCFAAYHEADKYPVASEGWLSNTTEAGHWAAEAQRLTEKTYGTNR